MNPYAILPLLAFFANIILACFVLYRDLKGKLNAIYAFTALAVAIWSLGDFFVFSSATLESALFWDKLSTFGAVLVPVLLLNFVLFFTKNTSFSGWKTYLLYIPGIVFEFFNLATNIITGSVEEGYWGYRAVGGFLYVPFIIYLISYTCTAVYLCFRFYSRAEKISEKAQSKLITIAVAVPLVGGVFTKFISTLSGIEFMPLTTTLTTLSVFVIAYAIVKYKLMTPPISFTIQKKIMLSFLIIVILMCALGYSGVYALNHLDASTRGIMEEQQVVMTSILNIKSDLMISRLELDQYIATANEAHSHELERILDDINKSLLFMREKRNTAMLDEIITSFESYRSLVRSLVSFYEKNPEDTKSISTKKVRIDSLMSNALLLKLDSLYDAEEKKIGQLVEESHNVYIQSIWNIIFFSFILIVMGGISSFLISKSISDPLIKMAKVVPEIARGNFGKTIDITSKDEIGELAAAFNQMSKDLLEYKKQIEKHSEELERRVEERTKELNEKVKELTEMKTAMLNMMEDMDEANKELIKTQEKLKKTLADLREMDVKKDQFISVAAHELKTPLTSIHGFSQLLQNKKVAEDPAKREKYLKIMEHETGRLSKLVNDILDLSRIDLGTVKLAFEKVNVSELIENVRKEMDMQIKEKGLQSEYIVEKKLPEILTDREKLTEIMINLINNAVKYTPKGKITVKVFKDGQNVHFVVKDTGVGIPKDKQERIFERFYQIDSSFTRKAGGTGLGLALCKEFVTLLGGKIWVKSEKGKGSEFHFILPIKGPEEEKVVKMEEKAKKALKKSKELKKRLKEFGWEVKP